MSPRTAVEGKMPSGLTNLNVQIGAQLSVLCTISSVGRVRDLYSRGLEFESLMVLQAHIIQ